MTEKIRVSIPDRLIEEASDALELTDEQEVEFFKWFPDGISITFDVDIDGKPIILFIEED